MGYEGIRGRTGARAWEVIHIYTGSFTPSPDPTPFYRRLISTRKGGLTTNGIHLLIPASLSNRSGPPQAHGSASVGSYPHIHRLVHPLPGPYPLLPPPDLDKEGRVDNQRDTPPNTRLTVQPIRATSTITDDSFSFERDLDKIATEEELDGLYIVRSNVEPELFDAEQTVTAYKDLAKVERAFRSMKTVDLKGASDLSP